jgi:hypothetical protein
VVSFTTLPPYPRGKNPPLVRRMDVLQGLSERYGKVKILESTETRTEKSKLIYKCCGKNEFLTIIFFSEKNN